MTSELKRRDSDKESDLFHDYDEFAKVLRTWFVAYGIGGPVLLLTNEAVRSQIATSGFARCIASAFLIGVGLQVLLALFNKTALWLCYKAEREPRLRERRAYRAAEWFAYEFWIDFFVDLSSFVVFAWATYRVFMLLTAA
jgi:hypothetical protein